MPNLLVPKLLAFSEIKIPQPCWRVFQKRQMHLWLQNPDALRGLAPSQLQHMLLTQCSRDRVCTSASAVVPASRLCKAGTERRAVVQRFEPAKPTT